MNLSDITQTLEQFPTIEFIYIADALALTKEYSRKNRRKNNQIEYQLSDNEKQLYRITRGGMIPTDWCGDFVINVTTPEVVKEALAKYEQDIFMNQHVVSPSL
jgi:hypothetical protein